MSMETGMRGRTQMPAHSGANSRGSKGIAASGIRVTLRGATSMGGPPPLRGIICKTPRALLEFCRQMSRCAGLSILLIAYAVR